MSRPQTGLLIIGACQAGVQLASSVRELGWRDPVTLVDAERHLPYARPPLSKAFLLGDTTLASMALRAAAFYQDQNIDLVLGEYVDRLEITRGGGGIAHTVSGRSWEFDRLALATGARPRRLRVEGAHLDGVVTLRHADHAVELRRQLEQAQNVVVVGGGFVGLEVAAAAAASGCDVTVLEVASTVLARVVSPLTARFVEAAHRAAGIGITTGVGVRRLIDDGRGRVAAVELADGTLLPAELVVVGVGARPNDELARMAGLACDNGVLVDDCSRASDGWTLAVGDCANIPDPSPFASAGARLRLESVDNAVEQARAAATTVVGSPRPYRSLPWFWSDQGALKLQMAGLATSTDEVVLRPGRRAGQQTVLRYRDDRLVGVECVNAPADFLTVRKALVGGRSLPPSAASDVSVPLKQQLASQELVATPPTTDRR